MVALTWVFVAGLTACASNGAETSTTAATATTSSTASTVTATDAGSFDEFDPFVLTVNVEITDGGYDPESVFVPAGRQVQIIIRNRTRFEHHYRVRGMPVSDLLWLSLPDMEIQEGVSEEEHLLHHQAGFVDWRGTSPAGITPTLDEVHAYSAGGVNDAVRFVALEPGTWTVDDPLYPEFTGTVTVFD